MARIFVKAGIAKQGRIIVKPRLRIERANLTYLEERGWVNGGNTYRGSYITRYGKWPGEIQCRNGKIDFYIYKPPAQLRESPHWPCFSHMGNNWWWIHFYRESPIPSDGVMAIERVISEAYALAS